MQKTKIYNIRLLLDLLALLTILILAPFSLNLSQTNSFFIYADTINNTDFVTTWKTNNPGTSNSTSITVPIIGGPYDVDWDNDGIYDETGLTNSITHDFIVAGTYTIRIKDAPQIQFNNGGDKEKIISIDQWGTSNWTSMAEAFYGCVNLVIPATDTPNFSNVTSMASMFQQAPLANPDTSPWDTSQVTSMYGMFQQAPLANPDTSSWDTSKVINMERMFYAASSANPDTSSWNTSQVTTMNWMFLNAISANPDTSSWDTSQVTTMERMFYNASSANPDTSSWDTSQVTSMYGMFQQAPLANPDTSSWDTSKVINMERMFYAASSANPDTSSWDTSQVTTMNWMFLNAISANPDTSSWNTSQVTTMERMFYNATSANPNVSNWDTSHVTNMSNMFRDAISANPDTSSWDTSQVTTMERMFYNATSAIPDTTAWNLSSLTQATNAFYNSGLTGVEYDDLLIAWSTKNLQNGVDFGTQTMPYCKAEAARQAIIDNFAWTITDEGKNCGWYIPDTPPAPDLPAASDSGLYDNDDITKYTSISLNVTCQQAGYILKIYTNNPLPNTQLSTHTCQTSGPETVNNIPIIEGTHLLTYTANNKTGPSNHSPGLTVIIDTTPPAPPTILRPTSFAILNTHYPTISGIAPTDTRVNIIFDSRAFMTFVNSDTSWQITLPYIYLDNFYRLSANTIDIAGNPSRMVWRYFSIINTSPPPDLEDPIEEIVEEPETPPTTPIQIDYRIEEDEIILDGIGAPNTEIRFSLEENTYDTITDDEGKFTIIIDLISLNPGQTILKYWYIKQLEEDENYQKQQLIINIPHPLSKTIHDNPSSTNKNYTPQANLQTPTTTSRPFNWPVFEPLLIFSFFLFFIFYKRRKKKKPEENEKSLA